MSATLRTCNGDRSADGHDDRNAFRERSELAAGDRPQILRDPGAPVDLLPFLHAPFAHVTGTLVSVADAANYPAPLGLDFMLLPNPNAALYPSPARHPAQPDCNPPKRLTSPVGLATGFVV